MYRTIRPKNGYCFVFPQRKDGKRFLAGQSVHVWLWEEWKHIRLGVFSVTLPDTEPYLVTTSENIEVDVKAEFKIVVGGPDDKDEKTNAKGGGREKRLEAATLSCAPTKNVGTVVDREFFKEWARNYCVSSIQRVISDYSFVQLLEDSQDKVRAEKEITEDLNNTLLGSTGLLLVNSNVVIELKEPTGGDVPVAIKEKWLNFRESIIEIEKKQKKLENQKLISDQELEDDKAAKLEDLGNVKRMGTIKKENKFEIEEKQEEKAKEEKLKKEQDEINEGNLESQLLKIANDAKVKEKSETEAERIRCIERNNAEYRLKHQLDMDAEKIHRKLKLEQEEHEHSINILELEKRESEGKHLKMQLEEKASKIEIDIQEKRGKVESDILAQKTLAKSADLIKMREIFINMLPQIVENVYKPIEKIGEMKINYWATPDQIKENGLISGILSSASTLPLIKEVLKYFKEADILQDSHPEDESKIQDTKLAAIEQDSSEIENNTEDEMFVSDEQEDEAEVKVDTEAE